MTDSIKYWVVVKDEDHEEVERHFFRTEDKAKAYLEKVKDEWQASAHTEEYKEWDDDQARRVYVWVRPNTTFKCSRVEDIKCFEEEMKFEDRQI